MSIANDIRDIFSIFHDGSIVAIERPGNDLRIKVEIPYLAELIEKEFTFFQIILRQANTFELKTWDDGNFTNHWMIANLEIGILSTTIDKSNTVCIHCEYQKAAAPRGGGTLFIDAQAYEIYNQGDRMSLDQLKELSRYYWEEVMGR